MTPSDREGFVLLRAEPQKWLVRLYEVVIDMLRADADSLSMGSDTKAVSPVDFDTFKSAAMSAKRALMLESNRPLFESKDGAGALRVVLTPEQERTLREWVSAHGDDFDSVFRSDRQVKPKAEPIGVRLKPGQAFTIPAHEVPEELRAGVLDLETPRWKGNTLTVQGRVPRLIPDSGLFGRMGLYEAVLEIADAETSEVTDPDKLRAVPITVGHFDPALSELHLGAPKIASLDVVTTADEYRISIAPEPVQVRRWRRWQSL